MEPRQRGSYCSFLMTTGILLFFLDDIVYVCGVGFHCGPIELSMDRPALAPKSDIYTLIMAFKRKMTAERFGSEFLLDPV